VAGIQLGGFMPKSWATKMLSRETLATGRKHSGNIAGGAELSLVVDFVTPLADTNYTVCATPVDSTGQVSVVAITDLGTSGVTVRLKNNNSLTTRAATVHVVAIHD
jgi:hypothetical protein